METKENKIINQDYDEVRNVSCISSKFPADAVPVDNKEEDISTLTLKDIDEPKTLNQLLVVTNPIIKDAIKSYVIYTLIFNEQADNAIHRRFSDFYALRSKLTERWPGVFIPNIPPKKTVGNLEKKVVEMRMKLLNTFCQKLQKFPSIFNSDEMRVFLSNTTDLTKSLNSLPLQSYEDIYVKYRSAFPDFYENYDISPAKIRISEFSTFLKKAVANLKNFKEIVFQSVEKKQQEIDNYNCLISVFSDYEKYTLSEYSDNDDNKLIFYNPKNTDLYLKILKLKDCYDNPYVSMHDWLQEEEIDFEAMSEAIFSLENLYLSKEKLSQNLSALDAKIISIKSGKKTFKSFFNLKSRDEEITALGIEKVNGIKTLNDMESVIKVVTFNMESYMEYFKIEKLAGYYKNLKVFADMQKSNSGMINDIWQTVAQDKNIKMLIVDQSDEKQKN